MRPNQRELNGQNKVAEGYSTGWPEGGLLNLPEFGESRG